MPGKKLKIVHAASEVDPYSKSGGLADVARSLPKAIKRLGHNVIVTTPLYSEIIDVKKFGLKKIIEDIKIEMSEGVHLEADFWQGELMPGLPIYFVENNKYFGKRKTLYGSKHENARFLFFDLATLKLLKLINFQADIIQCHDWHTGLIPYFLKGRYKNDPFWQNTATLYTIHNLLFQLGHNWWSIKSNLRDDGYSKLPPFDHTNQLERINFAKRAIINTDLINAVSEQYAQEIMTKDFGEDLHRILKNREKILFGIINGIDYKDYNPKTDPGLISKYDVNNLEKKVKNKAYLQKKYGLPVDNKIPLIGMVTRITEQKGFDLVTEILDFILKQNVQLFIMGTGDKKYESFFKNEAKKHPKKLAVHLKFERKRATLVYAASDMFLMPSRFEPCGLGQLISLRYGSIPVVRSTGGLVDTVTDFNPRTGKGNGFVFYSYDPKSLLIAITRAIETYKYPKVWEKIVKEGMKLSHTWEIPAEKYIALYKKAIKLRRKK